MIIRAFLILVYSLFAASVLHHEEVLYIIMSQKHPYHMSLAERLQDSIEDQVYNLEKGFPTVIISTAPGSWTVLPQLRELHDKHQQDFKWVVFCEDHTEFRLNFLHDVLSEYDHNEEHFLGHGLKDVEPTIIHHFALVENGLTYPNFGSGFAMSVGLLRTVNKVLKTYDKTKFSEFSIDPAYELAKFILEEGPEVRLTHRKEFCVVSSQTCATFPKSYGPCGDSVQLDSLFFAVKTYHKFHNTRVQVVKKTWGKFPVHMLFFSDKNDSNIPSIELGVPNVDRGHCAKTLAIINYFSTALHLHDKALKWLVIADDDTILSVARLTELLSCYGHRQLALGERYGFHVWKGRVGYDYLTGGGALVLSADLLAPLAACACPAPTAPDDMWLGVCLSRLGVPLAHSPLFHQGRPMDYALEYLAPHRPVSFHKHWMLNPEEVYRQWFLSDDLTYSKSHPGDQEPVPEPAPANSHIRHIEL